MRAGSTESGGSGTTTLRALPESAAGASLEDLPPIHRLLIGARRGASMAAAAPTSSNTASTAPLPLDTISAPAAPPDVPIDRLKPDAGTNESRRQRKMASSTVRRHRPSAPRPHLDRESATPRRPTLRRLGLALLAFPTLVALGTIGYMTIEGWSVSDALFMAATSSSSAPKRPSDAPRHCLKPRAPRSGSRQP
jgi:hypothetical protein